MNDLHTRARYLLAIIKAPPFESSRHGHEVSNLDLCVAKELGDFLVDEFTAGVVLFELERFGWVNPDFFTVNRQSLAGHGRGAEEGLHADEVSVFDVGHGTIEAREDPGKGRALYRTESICKRIGEDRGKRRIIYEYAH